MSGATTAFDEARDHLGGRQYGLTLNDCYSELRELPPTYQVTNISHHEFAALSGHPDDYCFRFEAFGRLPEALARRAAAVYTREYETYGRIAANDALMRICRAATPLSVSLASSDDQLVNKAKQIAKRFTWMSARAANFNGVIEALAVQLLRFKIHIADLLKKLTPKRLLARAKDAFWWRRLLRVTVGRAYEAGAIMLGSVHRLADLYVSKRTFTQRQEQRTRCRNMLESHVAINEQAEELTLLELAARSVSNPVIRRNEWMARCYGFEQYANKLRHVALFITVTCPSRMHARLSRFGEANPTYDDTSPQAANKYLTQCWGRARAKLKRCGVVPYGMRIAEPHHDGTPHWHLLLFVPQEQVSALLSIVKEHFLRTDGNESGARSKRVTYEAIDPAKGSATGYIAKYVSKNLDGYQIDQNANEATRSDSAKRVDAWRSRWGIRQFQQIGGPPVTVWRELRRLDPAELNGLMAHATQAARAGDWLAYVEAMGGPGVQRKQQPIRLASAWSDKPNRYDEPSGNKLIGLSCANVVVPTRWHTWKIERRAKTPQPPSEQLANAMETLVQGEVNLSPTFLEPQVQAVAPPPRALDHGEAGSATRSEAGPIRAQPGGACLPSARSAGVPVSSARRDFPPWSSFNNCTGQSKAACQSSCASSPENSAGVSRTRSGTS